MKLNLNCTCPKSRILQKTNGEMLLNIFFNIKKKFQKAKLQNLPSTNLTYKQKKVNKAETFYENLSKCCVQRDRKNHSKKAKELPPKKRKKIMPETTLKFKIKNTQNKQKIKTY